MSSPIDSHITLQFEGFAELQQDFEFLPTNLEKPYKPLPYYLREGHYRYTPIGEGSTRVLFLLEAESFDDDLKGALLDVSLSKKLDDDFAYTALSYVWGTERSTHTISIGNETLYIGANLDSALRHIRRCDRPLLLWVDAICINQSDVQERNDQVYRMRQIYESAKDTIVYLGDQSGEKIGISAWNYLERNSSWALDANKDKDYSLPSARSSKTSDRGGLHDVYHDVLCRLWFSRVWVFQEAVVSKEISIQCGHRCILWDDFVRTVILHSDTNDPFSESLRQRDNFMMVRQIWQARVAFHLSKDRECYLPTWYKQSSNPQETQTNILDMLLRARNLRASDARDKIFALLGISTGFDWEANSTINYRMTTSQVYTTFARQFMAATEDYRLLSYLNKGSAVQSLDNSVRNWKMESERYGLILKKLEAIKKQELNRNPSTRSAVLEARLYNALREEPFAILAFRECSSQVKKLSSQREKYTGVEQLELPSWVPDWQCIPLESSEPRAIIEATATLTSDSSDVISTTNHLPNEVESFRTWLPSGPLAIHGRVIGKPSKVMSTTSLVGKNEADFEVLRHQWERGRFDLVGTFFDTTANKEVEHCLNSVGSYTISSGFDLHKRVYDIKRVLEKPPGTHYPGSYKPVSFLDYIDTSTVSPVEGSIEAHLISRARKSAGWSSEQEPPLGVTKDRGSIIDQRLIGVYDTLLEDLEAPNGVDKSQTEMPSSHLILLPPTAQFGDVVAYFPGAKLPFLVRPIKTCIIMESQVKSELTSGGLPLIDYTERYMECSIVGECWINRFAEIASDPKKFSFVFGVV
ncbi:heterokaryon incompatibility protein-domain-containing protein [Dactylonectria estremocensis]|uniref:Heterokaryon incompatibility protein-domain-containing protein n=1 Tax=Dactylonectria estremocensis TaxID=1079267 RepID=A0A9P9FJQ8_9HYPO|nr:heterokaryon incompatibility protein-domain-containing protein [Dactylonectria estremocensis]